MSGAEGDKPTVLLVDDDDDIRDAISLLLELGGGYRVLTASDGEEALRVLRSSEHRPFLIILDLMMPGMNGWGFRAEQLRDESLASIPVVILSGAGELQEKAAELGIAEFIVKPVGLDTLLDVVRRHRIA